MSQASTCTMLVTHMYGLYRSGQQTDMRVNVNVDVDIFRRMIVWMYTAEVEIRDTNDAVAFSNLRVSCVS